MPIGASLHIGLNAVDPKQYSGWDGQLTACEFDANDMQALAKTQGFTKVTKRLTKKATRNRVLADIKAAASKLKRNDIFFLTYSGHGGQVPNTGNDLEPDGFDETWCLYDGELIDDELYAALKQFVKGVRIFVLSDSCHSGTVLRAIHFSALGVTPVRPRMMPRDVALRVYMDHQKFYDKIQQRSCQSAHADARHGALDFRMSRQPDERRWRSQRFVHRNCACCLEKRKVQGRLPRLPQIDRETDAADADAKLFHHRTGQLPVRRTGTVYGVIG